MYGFGLSNTFVDADVSVDRNAEPDMTNTATTKASSSTAPVTATSVCNAVSTAATAGGTTTMSNPSCSTSVASGETHETTAKAKKNDICVSAGGIGSDSFTDSTDGSFGSESFVQTSDIGVRSDQIHRDDWTPYQYDWRSEVGEYDVILLRQFQHTPYPPPPEKTFLYTSVLSRNPS